MKRAPRFQLAVLMAALSTVAGASPQAPPSDPPRKEAPAKEVSAHREQDETIATIRQYSVERRNQAVALAQRATQSMDEQIRQLQVSMDEHWARMDRSARARSRSAMQEIQRRRTTVAEWYGGMQHSSSAAWEQVRGGFARSYDELALAFRRARAEFERDSGPAPVADKPAPKQEP